jgi:hypothetical protein
MLHGGQQPIWLPLGPQEASWRARTLRCGGVTTLGMFGQVADTFSAAPPREIYLGGAEDSTLMRGASTGPIIRSFGDRCRGGANVG